MLLTIFGAGASYDSAAAVRPNVSRSDIAQWRPPLTDGLFADREEFRPLLVDFPRVLPLAARLGQASATQPLEGMLLRLQEEALDYPARFSDLASIRYYLQRVIWECERFWHQERRATTNHLALMDRIQRWRRGNIGEVLFTTFNYDRFLEYAASFYLSDASTIYHNQFQTIGSYIESPAFPIIKLHGSLDWGYRVNTPLPIVADSGGHVWQIAHEVIRRFPELEISKDISRIVERPPQPMDGYAYVPAIAIPINAKAAFVCPQAHLDYLAQRLPEVTSVLAVGWRGMEPHFLSLLRGHLTRKIPILAVSGNVDLARETLANMMGAGIPAIGEAYAGGFSDLVLSEELDRFLETA